MAVEIKAARSGFVKTLLVADGSNVTAGEPVLQYDEGLDRCTSTHLEVLECAVLAMENRLTADRLEKIRSSLVARMIGAEAELEYRRTESESVRIRVEMGMEDKESGILVEVPLTYARLELEKVRLQRASFESLAKSVPKQLAQMRNVWAQKQAIHLKRLAEATHAAPSDGTIFWEIFENGFAEEGTVIGLIR